MTIGWVRFDSFPDQELIAEKNLTLLIKFGIILIESERVTICGWGRVSTCANAPLITL